MTEGPAAASAAGRSSSLQYRSPRLLLRTCAQGRGMGPVLENAQENKVQAALYTIGYEGAEIGSFVAALTAAGVSVVVDIRDVAHSRKPGFSKSSLRQHLTTAGLGYVHLRDLGDPKPDTDNCGLWHNGSRRSCQGATAHEHAAR